MKLVHEQYVNRGLLIRTVCAGDTNTPLLPGDLVRHFQDNKSSGMIIAVSGDGRENPDIEALVLWSKLPFNGNYPAPKVMPGPSSTNPCAEVALQDVMQMSAMGLISKRTALKLSGFDPDELPEDV